jgi:hypothetical protein
MTAETTPDANVFTSSIAANIAMTAAMPAAVHMNSHRRPARSMKYQVPSDATKNQISRNPDMSSAICREKPIEFWKLDSQPP